MTSQERVLAAINHQTSDKIPVDMGATPSSGISAIAYSNLLTHLGRTDLDVHIYDVVQQLAQPDMSIIDQFGIDVIDIGRTFNAHQDDWRKTVMANGHDALYPNWFHPVKNQMNGAYETFDDDGLRVLARMPEGATFFDQAYYPYVDGFPTNYLTLDEEMNRVLWARYAHSPWDHANDDDFWTKMRENAIHLRNTTDKALMVVCGCNLFEWGSFLRRLDNFLMDLILNPKEVEAMLDELMERHLETLAKVCEAVGDVVDIIRFGDDLGMTTGPFMDPNTYRSLFKPRHKLLNDYVKQHSKMKTFIHSCGSISLLMPDMIEAGFEIFNPVQTNCVNMEPAFLKKEFGKDVTFWGGGVETVGTLNNGSPEQIRDEVLERLNILSQGGGFVFNTVHNILPDVPPENIIAMFDAVNEFNN